MAEVPQPKTLMDVLRGDYYTTESFWGIDKIEEHLQWALKELDKAWKPCHDPECSECEDTRHTLETLKGVYLDS